MAKPPKPRQGRVNYSGPQGGTNPREYPIRDAPIDDQDDQALEKDRNQRESIPSQALLAAQKAALAKAEQDRQLRVLSDVLGSVSVPASPTPSAASRGDPKSSASPNLWPDRLHGDPPMRQYGPARKAVSEWNSILNDIDKPARPAGIKSGSASSSPQPPSAADLQQHGRQAVEAWDDFLKSLDGQKPSEGTQKPNPQTTYCPPAAWR